MSHQTDRIWTRGVGHQRAGRARRIVTLTLSATALLLGLAACAPAPSAVNGSGHVQVSDSTIVLDVRSADEYAAGHLTGTKLLDFNGGDVAAAIPSLDPDAEYLIYCRSGSRAGQAIALMEKAGFTNLTNLGSLEQAAEVTGLTIVN